MLLVEHCYTKNTNIFPIIKKLYNFGLKTFSTDSSPSTKYRKLVHPYKQLHPWKSKENFYQYLLETVTYNNDGLVALNKPYGIRIRKNTEDGVKQTNCIPNSVNYTLSDSLPFLAKQLGYSELIIAESAEMHNSGVVILAANQKVLEHVKRSQATAMCSNSYPFVYWIVTTKLPREVNGTKKVGITLKQMNNEIRPVIVHSWTNASLRNKSVKTVRAQFQLLSNSTGNLASLIELKLSSRKSNVVRLFPTTELYSPILGDNYYGSRVQHVMGTWLAVNPFSPVAGRTPVLHSDLLKLLEIRRTEQEIIPPHIHLKQIALPRFGPEKTDLNIEASLPPHFVWTCKQLTFDTNKIHCPEMLNLDDYEKNDKMFST